MQILRSSGSNPLLGMAHIMRLAFAGNNLSEIASQLASRIKTNAFDSVAMMDLSIVLQLNANPHLAIELQSDALNQQQYFELKSNPKNPALKLLAIMGPGEVMANTPIDFLIENSDIALSFLYLGEGLPVPTEIPEHDVAFVAVCESDQNQNLLKHLSEVMQFWPKPFVNEPSLIAQLSRNRVSQRLASAAGVAVSDAVRVTSSQLRELGKPGDLLSFPFPVIARPLDSHAGHGLAKIDDCNQLERYLSKENSHEYFVAPFIDYRSKDGMYRKYRIAIMDGQPFAAHMAISRHWMVHYLNADMLNSETNRQTEAEFMRLFDQEFGLKHKKAFASIDQKIGLNYYSIDCAETQDGKLLVFELDSGAVVHSMDPIDLFPYKAPQMQRVFDAFRDMLMSKADLVSRRRVA
ncbi:MAG: RimK family alpha-L-glutamate ligase [Planctomycetota bacterium]|nr:RimK family alpha-L-glutamate ligase [Planctomycetota bacterium]